MSFIVKRFLRNVMREWREAVADRSARWPNRCLTCEKPLLSPIHKWQHCVACYNDMSFKKYCEDNKYCYKCSYDLEERVEHQCIPCECPKYTSATGVILCTCETFWDSDSEESLPCARCGTDCLTGDYAPWKRCSRRCLSR